MLSRRVVPSSRLELISVSSQSLRVVLEGGGARGMVGAVADSQHTEQDEREICTTLMARFTAVDVPAPFGRDPGNEERKTIATRAMKTGPGFDPLIKVG